MTDQSIDSHDDFQSQVNYVYLSEMFGEQKTKTEQQLVTYREELMKYLSMGCCQNDFDCLSEKEIAFNNQLLHKELSLIIQITTK